MSKLRGVKPEEIIKRLKLFVFGPEGIGKTLAVLMFKKAYVIDGEKGTENYTKTINKAESVVLHSIDYEEIIEQIEALATEKHPYRTLIIDPGTTIYGALQDTWRKRFAQRAASSRDADKINKAEMLDFGPQYWGKVKSDWKALQRLILRLDMNVIVTAHEKMLWGDNFVKLGVTFDCNKDDGYFFDYVFRMYKKSKGEKVRWAETIKQRVDPIGGTFFPDDFIWSYENFIKYYDKNTIEREAEPLVIASIKQVQRIKQLIEIINIEPGVIEKWYKKADVGDWGEFTYEQLQKCIDYCEKKMNGISSMVPDEKLTPAPTKQVEQSIEKKATPPERIEQPNRENNGKRKRGRPKKVETEEEIIIAIHKVKERLVLLEVPSNKVEDMVVNLRTHILGEGTEQLTLNDYDKIYAFLGRVKAREGYEIDKDLFRSVMQEVLKEEKEDL